MRRGRPRLPGTDAERTEARKERTRKNVAAFRQRQKAIALKEATTGVENGLTIIFERSEPLRSRSVKHTSATSGKHEEVVSGKDLNSCKAESHVLNAPEHDKDVDRDQCNNTEITNNPFSSDFTSKSRDLLTSTSQDQQNFRFTGTMAGVYQPDTSFVYQDTFLQLLIDRYLPPAHSTMGYDFKPARPDKSDQQELNTCSTWIIEGYSITKQHELRADTLRDALLALALSICSRENGDPRILHTARQTYSRALTRLQSSFALLASLAQYSRHNDEISNPHSPFRSLLGLACLACAVSEIVANRCTTSFLAHLDGIAQLIQSRGQQSLSCPLARALFFEHRGIYISSRVLLRKTAFYSRPEWINFPARIANSHLANPYHELLDTAYLIPEALVAFDIVCVDDVPELLRQFENVRAIDTLLDVWQDDFAAAVRGPLVKLRSSRDHGQDLLQDIDFETFGRATAMLYFFAFKIHVAELLVDLIALLPTDVVMARDFGTSRNRARTRSLRFAKMICRSMQYCFDTETRLVGKLIAMFPFETAWLVFRRAELKDGEKKQAFDGRAWCAAYAYNFAMWGLPLILDPDE